MCSACAATSLKRWLRRKTSRNDSVCEVARRRCIALAIMMAHEASDMAIRTPATSHAIGPVWRNIWMRPGAAGSPI